MRSFGYTLSSEEHGPGELVVLARRTEELGFDFVSILGSLSPRGRARTVTACSCGRRSVPSRRPPSAWAWASAFTCPIVRIHPVILAHATATTSLLLDGRLFWGVGTGEALNEHVVARACPRRESRLEMLGEAVDLIRELWKGDTVDQVHVGMTKDQIKSAPEYDADRYHGDPDGYHREVGDYYGPHVNFPG
jgi:alkanesulfonate monooxygenase SsuD/methylene tetrahydromethanopterin reductase-like flavin-dependent oxidoreductase (luciferase family)